ncbi:MAG: hypothetical protein NTX50_30095 [Candidatus Sumerlaeota bacterium]|nr:hypothetical protein [Candidatus Sumerlaeota bacterium]
MMKSHQNYPFFFSQYHDFLVKAKGIAVALTKVANLQKHRDQRLYEQGVVYIHRILLAQLLNNGEKYGLQSSEKSEQTKIQIAAMVTQFKEEMVKYTKDGWEIASAIGFFNNCIYANNLPVNADAPCVAVGVNFRDSRVANARVSSYGMDTKLAFRILNDENKDAITETVFEEHAGRFFTESIDLYFSIFGRGNTLNERLLDSAKKWRKADTISLAFLPKDHKNDIKKRTPALSISEYKIRDKIESVTIDVSEKVWYSLIHDKDGNLAIDYFNQAWNSYASLAFPVERQGGNGIHKDWIPEATNQITRDLARRLWSARSCAESEVLASPGDLSHNIMTLYPEEDLSTAQKLSKFLALIQGSICLVPWATVNEIPLPVITIPAIDVSGSFKSGWTIIPSEIGFNPQLLYGIRPIVLGLFAATANDDTHIENQGTSKKSQREALKIAQRELFGKELRDALEDLHKEISTDQESELISTLQPFQRQFLPLVNACKILTGDKHEGRDTSFRFIYGSPEVLKHIERVVSNESVGTSRISSNEPDKIAKAFSLTCRGHYSVFQQDEFCAYVDQFYGKLAVNKIVIVKVPPEEDLAEMRDKGKIVVDDRFRNLRWLTWKLDKLKTGNAAALIAGGDGILRIFVNGKLLLTWTKYPSPDQKTRWKLGLEFGTEESSSLGKLTAEIGKAMSFQDGSGAPASVRDLVSTICTISETSGEGALFIIGGEPWKDISLCDMVPDDFKMEWAQDRRLSGLEQRVLRSLAVMDGAIHIASNPKSKTHWVCARRYVAAAPLSLGESDVILTATRLQKDYLEQWIKNLSAAEKTYGTHHAKALENLEGWKNKMGAKGAKHRSVFQLCCLWDCDLESKKNIGDSSPLICSISADGPVNLYQIRICPKCRQRFLWTDEVIS